MATGDEDRCPNGHLTCAHCGSCICDGGPRVRTDRVGRTLCPGCREIDNNNHGRTAFGAHPPRKETPMIDIKLDARDTGARQVAEHLRESDASPADIAAAYPNTINSRYARELLALLVANGLARLVETPDGDLYSLTTDGIAWLDSLASDGVKLNQRGTEPPNNKEPEMTTKTRNTKPASTTASCGCGCSQPVNGKSNFRQGHDARMVSQLVAAVVGTDAGSRRNRQAAAIVPPAFDSKVAADVTGSGDIQWRIDLATTEVGRLFGQKLADKAGNALMNGWSRENDRNTNPRARRATKAAAQVVKAKVGRWTREGSITAKGEFQYQDKSGKAVTVAQGKYTLAD
ncbi:MAG TPA: hypothetical protein VFT75_18595 [Nocardioidaceae bacterium]|nr:hypothetical protein [Nocardioidaceae bacterium]